MATAIERGEVMIGSTRRSGNAPRIGGAVLVGVLAVAAVATHAAAVESSGNVFLQGQFVEVGIHPAGSFGSSVTAPAGFHPNGPSNLLGFVADPQRDGWDMGTPPQTGDYFVPGTPEEGWSVEWTLDGVETGFHNYGLRGAADVAQTSLTETSDASTQSALWEGDAVSGAGSLRVLQSVRVDPTTLYFVMNVTLTNTGSVALDSVEYMRNVDPDQEQPLTGDFTTSNYVALQPGVGGNVAQALVVGKGLVHGLTLGLGAIDARAVVSTEGFANRDPDAILDSPTNSCSEATPCVADQAIVLAFRFGTLAPGQSVSFDYAYILNEADLTAALGSLAAVTILQPVGTVSGDNVLFQATTDDVANTTQVEFFVDGVSIGVVTTPDAGGVYALAFDSTAYPNGPLGLKAVATFAGGGTAEKTSTVTVDNSGPPIAFAAPLAGATFTGTGIPILVTALDPDHLPVEINFFRETASTGSIFVGSASAEPFTSAFNVDDLPEGETVVIKAVARDALNRTTTIQVSGVVRVASCGDGVVGAGETCDDGNTSDGDCCSSLCEAVAAESPCEADGDLCSIEQCDGAGACVASSTVTCPAANPPCEGGEACNPDTGACEAQPDAAAGTACELDADLCTIDRCDGGGACVQASTVTCSALDQCHEVGTCDPGSGTCSNPAVPDGRACDDGNICTQSDQCRSGACSGNSSGADSDADGYCDLFEHQQGCDATDPAEIPPQAATYGGSGNGRTNVLVTYSGPAGADIAVGSDPSCAAAGVCGPPPLGFATGFCTAGRIGDPCTSNAQCGLPADTCRVVVNYADVPDLQLNSAFLNRSSNPIAGFSPAHAGCSRKVDVALDASRRVNRLRIKATGTVFGRGGRDRDSFRYRR